MCFHFKFHAEYWIIDSGASDHMTYNKSLLKNIRDLLVPYLITLPNEYKAKVTSVGSLALSSVITLSNVHFVPSFKYNLLSVHKLICQLDCDVLFTKTYCIMQGPSLKRQLALCNMIDGLYFVDNSLSPSTKLLDCLSSFTWLNSASSVNKVSKSTSSVSTMNSMNITACNTDCSMNKTIALWHSRLGHIPFSKMLKLSGISLLSSNKQSFICHVCPMARQQRLSFPSSTQVF